MERSRSPDGDYVVAGDVLEAFEKVFRKTTRGLFWGLYGRFIPDSELTLFLVSDQRLESVDDVIGQIRPPALQDITDGPLSELSPNSWHSRQPIIELDLRPIAGGPIQRRIFRLTRETPTDWVSFQEGIFRVGFVMADSHRVACVFDVWKSITVVMTAPWPNDRGPVRRGRNNPLSRDY